MGRGTYCGGKKVDLTHVFDKTKVAAGITIAVETARVYLNL